MTDKKSDMSELEERQSAAKVLGKKGGEARSRAKTKTARKNGKKGGRPPLTYAINVTRSFYGPRSEKKRLTHDVLGEWRGGRSEAIAKIKELDGAVYHLANNEASRPAYKMVAIND